MAPRLIVLGDCNPDLVLTGDVRPVFGQVEKLVERASLTIGGSGAITAAAAAKLGLETSLVATIGDDDLGRGQMRALTGAGVGTSAIVVRPGFDTGISVILSEGDDRAILTASGAIAALRSDDVSPEMLATADHVHVSALFLLPGLQPGLPHLLATARAAGATVSLDTNWDPSESWSIAVEPILDQVDVMLPNLAEARALSGLEDPEEAARALTERVPTVAVKLGAEGAIGASRGRAGIARAVPPPIAAVDTTGAGDTFNAGLIAARLAGDPLEQALRFAVACGTLATRGLGGVASQPTAEEARAIMGDR